MQTSLMPALTIKIVDEFKPTRRQLVLERLALAQQRIEFFHHHKLPAGYVSTGNIANEKCGGSSGPRRLRELRAAGLQIDMRYYNRDAYGNYLTDWKGNRVGTWIYRLITPQNQIDFENCCLKERLI